MYDGLSSGPTGFHAFSFYESPRKPCNVPRPEPRRTGKAEPLVPAGPAAQPTLLPEHVTPEARPALSQEEVSRVADWVGFAASEHTGIEKTASLSTVIQPILSHAAG